jgi:hypothetical protein
MTMLAAALAMAAALSMADEAPGIQVADRAKHRPRFNSRGRRRNRKYGDRKYGDTQKYGDTILISCSPQPALSALVRN